MPQLTHDDGFIQADERPCVLFVDDNLTQLDLYAMVVEPDMEVVTATRADRGYTLACREQPDVIVLDVVMPGGDGIELCVRLRANPQTAGIPIVILTGDEDAYARAQSLKSELTAILMKPCPADRLLTALQLALEQRAPGSAT